MKTHDGQFIRIAATGDGRVILTLTAQFISGLEVLMTQEEAREFQNDFKLAVERAARCAVRPVTPFLSADLFALGREAALKNQQSRSPFKAGGSSISGGAR